MDAARLARYSLRRTSYSAGAMIGAVLAVTLVSLGVGITSSAASSLEARLDWFGANLLVAERVLRPDTPTAALPPSLVDDLGTLAQIRSVFGVTRIQGVGGRLGHDDSQVGTPRWPVAVLYGLPATDTSTSLVWGRWPAANEHAVSIGVDIALSGPWYEAGQGSATVNGRDLPIVGVFESSPASVLGRDVIVISAAVAENLGLSAGPVTLQLAAAHNESLSSPAEAVQLATEVGYPRLEVAVRPAASVGQLRSSLSSTVAAFGLPVGIAVLVLSLTTQLVLVLLQVRSRSKEVAVRLVLGHRPWEIARTLTFEALAVAIPGALVGALIAQGVLLLHANIQGMAPASALFSFATAGFFAATIGALTMLLARLLISRGIIANFGEE